MRENCLMLQVCDESILALEKTIAVRYGFVHLLRYQRTKIPLVPWLLQVKSGKDELFFAKHSSCRTSALERITQESHITYNPLCSILHTLLKDKGMSSKKRKILIPD